jgi:membrane protein
MKELLKNDPLRMAGATAFFTTFALPPILVILIQVLRLIIDPVRIRKELFRTLSDIVGPEAVNQIIEVLKSMKKLAQNGYIIIGGFIFLLFVATTLFKVIRSSMNQVWKIRPYNRQGLVRGLASRAQSVLVILVAGILFMIGLLAEGAEAFIGSFVFELSPILSVYFNTFLHTVMSVLIEMLWFAMVFRYLPDGRPDWKTTLVGALVTAVLFTIGKLILHWLLSYSNITTVYGTSASIVLLLLFVFYSSLILYFGAAFTRVWAISHGRPIRPRPHATSYRLMEVEEDMIG